MTHNKADQNCYMPTAEEIIAAAAEVRANWTAAVEISRAGGNGKLFLKNKDGSLVEPCDIIGIKINRSRRGWSAEAI